MDKFERLKSFLFGRQKAYQLVFSKENQMALQVLHDLSKFCRADQPTFHADPRLHAVLEGRREVWLRIQKQLNLSSEELWQIYNRKDQE